MSSLRKRKGWFSIIGKRPDRTQWTHPLKTKDPVLAKSLLAQWRAEHGEAGPRAEISGYEWGRALDLFLEHVGDAATPETVECYGGPLRRMFTAWDDTAPTMWTQAMFRLWVNAHPEWAPRTKNLLAGAARRFLKWSRIGGWPVADFLGGYRAPKIVLKEPEVLDGPSLRRFLKAARGQPGEVAVALSALAGMRLGEVGRAERADYNAKAGTLRVRGRKGHAERVVPVGPELAAILGRVKEDGLLVPDASADKLRPILRRFALAAGIARYPTLRILRHTHASRMVANGVDLPTVQRLLGHKSAAMTMRYAHSDDKRARAAVGKVLA